MASGHYRTYCPALRQHDNVRCQKCLLTDVTGVWAHNEETLGRKTCEYMTCGDICYRLFQMCWRNDVILKFLMSEAEQREYLSARKVRSGAAKMKQFYAWLSQDVEYKQNLVRVDVSWAKISKRIVFT